MINFDSESLIPLKAAADLLPIRPTPSCLWRWWKHGVRGARLETLVIGGRRFTSREALQRFIHRTTARSGADNSAEDHAV